MSLKAIPIGGSSNIAGVAWDTESRALTVEFLSGEAYQYQNVPESVANGFTAAASPGQYFYRHIRNVYAYEKV